MSATGESRARVILRWVLAVLMVAIGSAHFFDAEAFVRIAPPWLPYPAAMVYISGAFEILGGLGLLVTTARSAAGYGLIALYVAVFPANIHMAMNNVSPGPEPVPNWTLWARLPFQFLFIAWAYWVSRPTQNKPD